MLPTQGAAHTLITQQTKGTSQFLAWHRGVERQPPWQKPSLHGTQEEQLEAVHLCSAVHSQESGSGGTSPADEPHGDVTSQTQVNKGVCVDRPVPGPVVCSWLSSSPNCWASLQNLLSSAIWAQISETYLRGSY